LWVLRESDIGGRTRTQMGDLIDELWTKLEGLRETNSRRSTPARVALIEGIEDRIYGLDPTEAHSRGIGPPKPKAEIATVEPAPKARYEPKAAAKAAASPKSPAGHDRSGSARNESAAAAVPDRYNFDEDIDAALSAQSQKKAPAPAAPRSQSPSIASTAAAWACESDAPAPTVVVWDLNHALIPHYQLKRHEDGPELFDAWTSMSQELQAQLPQLQVGNMKKHQQGRQKQQAEALYGSNPATLLREPDALNGLESDTNAALGGQLAAVKHALDYVILRGGCNVVITSSQLKPTAAKLIVFGMASMVQLDHVYCVGEGENKGKLMYGAFNEARSTIGGQKSCARYIFAAKAGRTEGELAKLARANHCAISCVDDLMNLKALIDGADK